MKFFAVAAALVAAVAAQGYPALPVAEECSAIVTVTQTVTLPYGQHTPVAPGTSATEAPYPTQPAPEVPTGTGSPAPPAAGTGYPAPPPAGTGYPGVPVASGTGAPAPSGTGAYTPGYPEFTGAASALNVGGFVAGVGAFAAFFL